MDTHDIDREAGQIWEELGPWWDANVEDGDYFHRAFIFPIVEQLLELQGGEILLDAGCGNGALSRRLAKQGATVFGVDFSGSLLKQARERSKELQNIQFEQMSLTDRGQLQALATKRKFDRIVCSMVLHDLSTVIPFFQSLRSLLSPHGSFIFSIPHPCFNSPSMIFEPPACITVKDYIQPTTSRMRSKPGQPIEQIVFHRPIREYFNLLFDQGLVMNGFEEPCVDPQTLPKDSLWGQRSNIPPALISRWICR